MHKFFMGSIVGFCEMNFAAIIKPIESIHETDTSSSHCFIENYGL